jgi:hypothetical protein
MEPGIKDGINQAKKNLDKLGEALDRVATDPKIREKLGTHPIETLTELGFELDDQDRAEILEELIVARTSGLAFPKFTSLVKSGVKSGVKVGVQTAATTAVKSVIKQEEAGAAKKPEDKSGKK